MHHEEPGSTAATAVRPPDRVSGQPEADGVASADASLSSSSKSLAAGDAKKVYDAISQNIGSVMRGQEDAIRKILAALASGAHVLIEDYPGTGKTTLAKALAASIAADFKRIQFTPDLLPSDILGVSIYDQREMAFKFRPGPVFAEILLGDEINRASPRTQSALLEAMGERQVSIDGVQHTLSEVFFVIATQNPVEFRGTYPLPEAQMDRFGMEITLGYVQPMDEVAILSAQQKGHPLERLQPVAGLEDVKALQLAVHEVNVSDELKRYIVDVTGATRGFSGVQLAASPRASLTLMKSAQALALFAGRDYVVPDDIQEIAPEVVAHRLVLDSEAKFSGMTGRQVVNQILDRIDVPG